jgi:chromosome segregation ATPase
MIESIMYFGGGFLVASLLALVLISLVHHRAVRLTMRRVEDAIPVSFSEIQAEKDNLRAEFAVTSRRLELSVEQLKAKSTSQLGEIARKTEAINRLKSELAEKTAVTDELDARGRNLADKIRETEQAHAVKAAAVESTSHALAAKEAELVTAESELSEARQSADAQRLEIAVLKTQVEQLKSQIDELQMEAQDVARHLLDERSAASVATKELEEKRQTVDILRPQVTQLEGEIAGLTAALGGRVREIDTLKNRVADQDQLLAQRDAEVHSLNRQLGESQTAYRTDTQRLSAEKTAIESLLDAARGSIASHTSRISELENWVAERDRLVGQRDAEAKALAEQIADMRAEHDLATERLSAERNSLDRLLQTAHHMLDTRAARIADLENWVSERDELVRQRDAHIASLAETIAAMGVEAEAVAERQRAELAARDAEVNKALDERRRAEAEVAAMHQEAEATWRAEKNQNHLLRERISDIAAQVAHLAMAAGRTEPIEAIDTESASIRPEAFEPGSKGEAGHRGNLTERIRMLERGISRVTTPS